MIIANPIYDSVFKFLMEDNEIAKGLLSAIMEEDIVELEFLPQETTSLATAILPAIFRLDFVATIRLAEGGQKKVLIELQKSQDLSDIMRFRRYLGQQYGKADEFKKIRQKNIEIAYPIVTIYFLGFILPEIETAVLKVQRAYFDVLKHRTLEGVKNEFVEKLTHDSFIIQIPRLHQPFQSRLEKLLSIFDQNLMQDSLHKLNYSIETEDPLQKLLIKRLNYAVQSPEIQATMDIEDQYEQHMADKIREKEEIIEQKEKALAEERKALEEERKLSEQKDAEIERLKKLLESKN